MWARGTAMELRWKESRISWWRASGRRMATLARRALQSSSRARSVCVERKIDFESNSIGRHTVTDNHLRWLF